MKKILYGLGIFILVMLFAGTFFVNAPEVQAKSKNSVEKLGEFLYFDENLSKPPGQSCASCHDPNFGFVDPDSDLPVSQGVFDITDEFPKFGDRNSPTTSYAMYAPSWDGVSWIGGQFWDGRATGEVLGDPLADQALGPFLNPNEMNNTKVGVVAAVAQSDYAKLFKKIWGNDSLNDTEAAYDLIALSIAAFERSSFFAPFSSTYDKYLKICLNAGGDKDDCALGVGPIAEAAGLSKFTAQEWQGLQLFMGLGNNNDGNGPTVVDEESPGAMCAACHVVDWTINNGNVVVPDWSPNGLVPPMFTDFTYDNLGVPKNMDYPIANQVFDAGLGRRFSDSDAQGMFKVMTVRNIGQTGPYMHNGLLETLKGVVHFYNTRDVPGANNGSDWEPEYLDTMNMDELGNLGLSSDQEDAIVAFLMTLSDK